TWALAEANDAMDLKLQSWPSLEAQVAAIADDIAYDNHDIDDGIRAGLLTLDQLLELPFIAERWQVISARFADVPPAKLLPELIRDQIGLMVNDVLETTRARIDRLGVQSPQDVRQAGLMVSSFSDEMAEKERILKGFMYENLYHHPKQMAAAEEGKMMVGDLVKAYRDQPELMPESWVSVLPEIEPARTRHIADFLAGMTDRYARNRHGEIFGERHRVK
ncbi:MAG: deoxyguanosinetriphosphate triphosphohydrolase, partial [Parasphingorhabdus sp.]